MAVKHMISGVQLVKLDVRIISYFTSCLHEKLALRFPESCKFIFILKSKTNTLDFWSSAFYILTKKLLQDVSNIFSLISFF